MFERFTERARQTVVFAQDEARLLKHTSIAPEHLLLGTLHVEEGIAVHVLAPFGMTVETVREQVTRIDGVGNESPTGQIPFTPDAKKMLELALREALSIGHNYVGVEHLLLAMARMDKGVVVQILRERGLDGEKLRTMMLEALQRPRPSHKPPVAFEHRTWEYQVEEIEASRLNELGAEGWELVSIVPGDGAFRLVFKRLTARPESRETGTGS